MTTEATPPAAAYERGPWPESGLTLAVYQQRAIATAEERAFHLEYLIPGILGEVGELFGQQAKGYWHQWAPEQLQKELVSEYGDICWMTALLLHTRGVAQLQPVYPSDGSRGLGALDTMSRLQQAASNLRATYLMEKDGISDTDQWLDEAAERMWRVLRDCCQYVTGVPFQEVLHANLAKLADRAARGVLKGQGDHR